MKSFLLISVFIAAAYAAGELTILHSPSSIEFKGNDNLDADSLSDVYAASLGHYVENPSGWNGLFINDPFSLPKSIVSVVVDGVDKVTVQDAKTQKYALVGPVASYFDGVAENIVDADLSQGLDVLSEYSTLFENIKPSFNEKSLSALKPHSHPEDKLILEEIAIIEAVAEKISELRELPSLVVLRVSITPLISAHSAASPSVTEALKKLSSAIEKLSAAVEEISNGDVLVTVVATKEAPLSRNKRQAVDETNPLNLAQDYDEDYPVIFNIMLWFGVAMFFSLLAICYAIGTMDPGRDSIIYRMTSTRMKKDN